MVSKMQKVLIIQSRPEDETSDDEFRAFLTYGGLSPYEVERVRGESAGIPDIVLDDYSAIIIGGGPFNITDPEQEKSDAQKRFERQVCTLIERMVAEDKPCLGACYAMGPVVQQCGGVASTKFQEDVEAKEITLTDDGQRDPLFGELPETFRAIVGHHEACEVPPPGAAVLASSDTCPVQALRLGNNVYVTQFHPELDEAGIRTRLEAYAQHGYGFTEETKDELINTLLRHDIAAPRILMRRFIRRYHRTH